MQPAGPVDEVLASHNRDGRWLLKTAYAVSNVYCRKTGTALDSRVDDLTQHLVLIGCLYALKYDPQKVKPGYSFESFLWDIMERRCADFFRMKREGFQDRRLFGRAAMVDLHSDITELNPADGYLQLEQTFGEGVVELVEEHGLSDGAVWALREVGGRIALGYQESLALRHAAAAAGIRVAEARARLERLREELAEVRARRLTQASPEGLASCMSTRENETT